MSHWVLIFASVVLTSIGQLFFKKGMTVLNLSRQGASIWELMGYGLLNSFVWLGFASFGAGAVLWLAVLAKEEVSYAYPLSSLGYLIVLLGSYILFHENISPARIIGILLLIIGIFFIEYSR